VHKAVSRPAQPPPPPPHLSYAPNTSIPENIVVTLLFSNNHKRKQVTAVKHANGTAGIILPVFDHRHRKTAHNRMSVRKQIFQLDKYTP